MKLLMRFCTAIFLISVFKSSNAQVMNTPKKGDTLPPYTIVLTYDDGPDTQTAMLADYLHQNGIKATFFLNGCNFNDSPNNQWRQYTSVPGLNCTPPYASRTVLSDLTNIYGHRIANHTEDHTTLIDCEYDAMGNCLRYVGINPNLRVPIPLGLPIGLLYEVSALQTNYLDAYITDGVYLFRAPGLGWDNEVADALRGDSSLNKLRGPIDADIGGGTPFGGIGPNNADYWCAQNGKSAQDCAPGYLSAIQNMASSQGVIVLLHDRNPWARDTVGVENYALQITRYLVEHLPRSQYKYVPVDAIPGLMGLQIASAGATWTTAFKDADGWNAYPGYYDSIRLADVNSDGKADVCGRGSTGIWCGLSTGTSYSNPTVWTSSFSDAQGWLAPEYGTTIMFGDVNVDGEIDVCGRGVAGVSCALSTGNGFASPVLWSSNNDFSDADGWNSNASYYGSLRLVDINGDGKADLCGRSSAGIVCAISDGTKFLSYTLWNGDFRDLQGWAQPEYGSTIQFADINGDGKPDVCGRGISGIICALSTGNSFGSSSFWTWGDFSDNDGWNSAASYYKSVKLADINGDGKADVCGRIATGIVCATSAGSKFVNYHYYRNDAYSDATGWQPDSYGSTIQFGDINGDLRADICGREVVGVRCSTF